MPTARAAHAHSKSRPCPHQEPPMPTPRATHAHSKSPMPPIRSRPCPHQEPPMPTASRPCPHQEPPMPTPRAAHAPWHYQEACKSFQDLKHWHGLMNCADTLVLIDVNRRLSEVSMVSPKIEPLNYQLSNRGVRASLWFYSAVTLLLSDLFNQPDSGKVAYCSVAATLWPVDGGPGGGGGGWQGWVGGVGGGGGGRCVPSPPQCSAFRRAAGTAI